MYDIEIGDYYEDQAKVARARSVGACVWVCLGVLGFILIMTCVPTSEPTPAFIPRVLTRTTRALRYIPISGVSDVPAYARSFLYMSTAHHFEDVQNYRSRFSPPPPSF